MKKVTLKVSENREKEFFQKLEELMKDCGVTIQHEPKEGDFVAFKDESSEQPFIGIFASFYADSKDKICCFAHINAEGVLEDEEEYWSADDLRPATSDEKDALLRELANENKCWNAEEMVIEKYEPYKAIRTFEDAMLATGITFPIDERTMSYLGADVVAYMKLRVIAAAINGLSETTLNEFPKFTVSERRYYPWFVLYTKEELEAMDEDKKRRVVGRAGGSAFPYGGCVFAGASDVSAGSYAGGGARLAFRDRERAEYAGKQFAELYADFLFIPKELIAE